MKYTDEQNDITETSKTIGPGEVLKVIAFAGAGKTTTLKGVAKARSDRGIYLAFNRSIADEARSKLALTKCSAETMHSLAYGAVREDIGSPFQISAKTVRESGILNRFNMPRVKGWNEYRIASAVGRTIAAFSASDSPTFLPEHGTEAIISAVGDPDFMKAGEKKGEATMAVTLLSAPLMEAAQAYWVHLIEEENKMSHDMYLKMVDLNDGLRGDIFRRFRYLVLDEAQDVNPVQLSIIRKTGLPLIAVGDPFQQIYSWRGAENSLDALDGKTRYLTQSFRFGEGIAETARHILSIRPDGGPEQILRGSGNGDISGHDGAKAAIVCRTNMGMIEESMSKMRRGIRLHIDNMKGLLSDVNSAQALYDGRPDKVTSQDLKPYATWDELQTEAEEGDGALARLVKLVETGMTEDVVALSNHHQKDPKDAQVMVCTAHRAKGLEWPAVILGQDWKDADQMHDRYAAAEKQSAKHVTAAVEEYNALYVAATRPMLRLQGQQRILFPEPDEELEYD